jgi:hypothetical protein
MTLVVSPTLDDVYKKLGDFIATVITGVPVIQTPTNRTPAPPPSPGYIGMTARLSSRIMTNIDHWEADDTAPTGIAIEQAVRLKVQLDCYGVQSGDWAVILSTVLRDEFGCVGLMPILAPLHADEPKFAPLVQGEEQYEYRWIVEAVLQYNPVVSTPQQFANAAEINTINVDERYPP